MEFAYFCFAFQRSAHSPQKNRETLLSRAASWIYPSSPRGSQPHSKLSELPVADHQHGLSTTASPGRAFLQKAFLLHTAGRCVQQPHQSGMDLSRFALLVSPSLIALSPAHSLAAFSPGCLHSKDSCCTPYERSRNCWSSCSTFPSVQSGSR